MQGILDWFVSGSEWIQMLSLVSGAVYMVLQVFQHAWMWYFGLVTAFSALIVTLFNADASGVWAPLWAQVALNGYFFTMDALGISSWRRLRTKLRPGEREVPLQGEKPRPWEEPLHLVAVTPRRWVQYAAITIITGPAICILLSWTNDPQPIADGLSMSLSIVAQLMLNRSHLEQWYPWLAADLIVAGIFVAAGDWWMAVLYLLYVLSCVAGLLNWKRRGVYVGSR